MTWVYIVGYAAIALFSMRAFYLKGFEADYQDSLEKQYRYWSQKKKLKSAREMGGYTSLCGLIWPISWPIYWVILFLTRPTPIEKDIEARAKAAEFDRLVKAEMIRLRKALSESEIPVPNDDILRNMAEENVKNNG